MHTALITNWQWSPPALALVLSRDRPSSKRPSLDEQIFRDCISPALEAETAADFLRELGRRLPLFTALHMKRLDELAGRLAPDTDSEAVLRRYEALEKPIRQWAEGLDEVTRAELEIALGALSRGNELLAKMFMKPPDVFAPGMAADLFRTSVLMELLLFCLWRLVELDQRPALTPQIVNSLRYAGLDHVAAIRRLTSSSEEARLQTSSPDPDAESDFWANVGRLPLVEMGEAA